MLMVLTHSLFLALAIIVISCIHSNMAPVTDENNPNPTNEPECSSSDSIHNKTGIMSPSVKAKLAKQAEMLDKEIEAKEEAEAMKDSQAQDIELLKFNNKEGA